MYWYQMLCCSILFARLCTSTAVVPASNICPCSTASTTTLLSPPIHSCSNEALHRWLRRLETAVIDFCPDMAITRRSSLFRLTMMQLLAESSIVFSSSPPTYSHICLSIDSSIQQFKRNFVLIMADYDKFSPSFDVCFVLKNCR